MKYQLAKIMGDELTLKPVISDDPNKLYEYLPIMYDVYQHIVRKTGEDWSMFEIWEVHWYDMFSKDIVVDKYTIIRLKDLDE